MIMNDILHLNNRVRLFQTQICIYDLSTSCRNPHAVVVRLVQGGEVGVIPVKTACTIEWALRKEVKDVTGTRNKGTHCWHASLCICIYSIRIESLNLDYRSPISRACGTVSEHELDFYFQNGVVLWILEALERRKFYFTWPASCFYTFVKCFFCWSWWSWRDICAMCEGAGNPFKEKQKLRLLVPVVLNAYPRNLRGREPISRKGVHLSAANTKWRILTHSVSE